jgi:hypothetical protein
MGKIKNVLYSFIIEILSLVHSKSTDKIRKVDMIRRKKEQSQVLMEKSSKEITLSS